MHSAKPSLQPDAEAYRRLKEEKPELAGEADPLQYGKAPEVRRRGRRCGALCL
jgi:hypothetical protein